MTVGVLVAVVFMALPATPLAEPAETPPAAPAETAGHLALLRKGRAARAESPRPPDAAALVSQPHRTNGSLSPSGRYFAAVMPVFPYDQIEVIDLATGERTSFPAGAKGGPAVVKDLRWKTEDRLLVSYFRVARGFFRRYVSPTLATFDRTGKRIRTIGYGELVDIQEDDPVHILVATRGGLGNGGQSFGALSALRVDIETGAADIVDRGLPVTQGWETDGAGRLALRYDELPGSKDVRILARVDGEWREVMTTRERDRRSLPEFEILGPAEPGKLYVAVKPEAGSGGDKRELRTFDFVARTMGPPLWSHDEYDLDRVIADPTDRSVQAACYWADVYECRYFDKQVAREFKALDAFFEGERNVRVVSLTRDGSIALLLVSGPDEPGTYYRYDRKALKIDVIAEQRPRLKPDVLGVMERIDYVARDGVKLRAYVTAMPGQADRPAPMIVMPHGGPESRDRFDFDPWVQAFASRGYLVIQPQFRGSGGYGVAFAEKGYGQWGGLMQDDLMDAVQAMIDQGRADPDRICIVGASYGGYAALYAGARAPDRFRCVVSIAGVSDLVAVQKWERDLAGPETRRYQYWLRSIGDPEKDRERLAATSPITYAADYRGPVLLIHGDKDDIVPVSESKAMEAALTAAGRKVEMTILEGEGHNDWSEDTEVQVLSLMLEFVGTAIGEGPATMSEQAPRERN